MLGVPATNFLVRKEPRSHSALAGSFGYRNGQRFGQGGLSNNSLVQEVMIVWYNRGHYTYTNGKALKISGTSKQIHCRWLSTPLIWENINSTTLQLPQNTKTTTSYLYFLACYKYKIDAKYITKCPFLLHQHPNCRNVQLSFSAHEAVKPWGSERKRLRHGWSMGHGGDVAPYPYPEISVETKWKLVDSVLQLGMMNAWLKNL